MEAETIISPETTAIAAVASLLCLALQRCSVGIYIYFDIYIKEIIKDE